MKTIGRIMVILTVFTMFAGLIVTVVNASGMNAPDFDSAPQFRPDGDGGEFRPGGDEGGFRPERGEGDFGGGLRWLFGAIKNIVVIGFLVTVIVLPKNALKKKKRAAVITVNDKL